MSRERERRRGEEREGDRDTERKREPGKNMSLFKGLGKIFRCISCLTDKNNVPFNSTDKVNEVTSEGCQGFACEYLMYLFNIDRHVLICSFLLIESFNITL